MINNKILLVVAILFVNLSTAIAQENIIKIELPTSVDKVDIKYGTSTVNEAPTSTVKTATNKTISGTKSFAQKTIETTKSVANKTVEGTKELIDDININQEISIVNLEKQASIKTLKNEKKELKSAYNSRIKDIKAKIKLTEQSTSISDVQKQNKIYNYEKQINELEEQRDSAIQKYDARIKSIKSNKKH